MSFFNQSSFQIQPDKINNKLFEGENTIFELQQVNQDLGSPQFFNKNK